ncbi:MAG: hypothetical protein M1814_000462 [Vezdaea aestivalis]|nr:MAG: hypothetical protein M1814_000462 [Vezdaea aestivalis]
MLFSSLLLSAVAGAQVAYGKFSIDSNNTFTANQSTGISCTDDPIVIQSSGDASALGGCQTISSLRIDKSASGDLSISGPRQIKGDFNADGADNVTSITMNDLQSIGGIWKLNGLTRLNALTFPRLGSVDTIDWAALPVLQSLSFSTGITMATNVVIQNTQLNSLDGINLKSVTGFRVLNNPYLTSISVQLTEIKGALDISANGRNLSASFPNLETAFNMTFRNASGVSVPSLATVNQTMGFFGDLFADFSAPNLTETGRDLVFVGCPELTSINLPKLTKIGGGYQIANNSKLGSIDGFKNLQTVGGAIDFSGSFTNVSLPSLKDVRGGFNLQTRADYSGCSGFQSLSGPNNVIKGTFTCKGNEKNPGGATGTSTGTNAKKTGAASHIQVSAAGMVGVAAGMVGLLL